MWAVCTRLLAGSGPAKIRTRDLLGRELRRYCYTYLKKIIFKNTHTKTNARFCCLFWDPALRATKRCQVQNLRRSSGEKCPYFGTTALLSVAPAGFDDEAQEFDSKAPDAADRPGHEFNVLGVQLVHLDRIHVDAEQTDSDVPQMNIITRHLHHEPPFTPPRPQGNRRWQTSPPVRTQLTMSIGRDVARDWLGVVGFSPHPKLNVSLPR